MNVSLYTISKVPSKMHIRPCCLIYFCLNWEWNKKKINCLSPHKRIVFIDDDDVYQKQILRDAAVPFGWHQFVVRFIERHLRWRPDTARTQNKPGGELYVYICIYLYMQKNIRERGLIVSLHTDLKVTPSTIGTMLESPWGFVTFFLFCCSERYDTLFVICQVENPQQQFYLQHYFFNFIFVKLTYFQIINYIFI